MESTFQSRERICRLCLGTQGYFVNIFYNDLEMDNLATKIMRCASIEVNKYDGLPDNACHRCVAKVDSSYEFRLLCESSDAKLRRLLVPKILDEEKYDIEKDQKQVLNRDIDEHTLNETSSEEISILFVSTKRTSASRGSTAKISKATGCTSKSKSRDSNCSISKPRFSPESSLNHQAIQENFIEHISVPNKDSASNQEIVIDISNSDQYLKCDTQHSSADCNSITTSNLQAQLIQEKLSNNDSLVLQNVSEINPIEIHQKQVMAHVTVNPHDVQAKESFSNLTGGSSEVLIEDTHAEHIIDPNVMLTSEKDSSLVLRYGDDSQRKKHETANLLTPSENLCSEIRNIPNDPESILFSSTSDAEPETRLHSHPRDIVELTCSKDFTLNGVDSVNYFSLPQCQPKVKRLSQLLPQPCHASAENAAEALIMLSNHVENTTSVPNNSTEASSPSTVHLANEVMCERNLESTTESNTDYLFDTSSLSSFQVEKNLVSNEGNNMNSDVGNKSSQETVSNESINVKIKRVSGKYSVERVRNYHLDSSTCITSNRTNITSHGAHSHIFSDGTRVTSSIKKDNLCTRNQISAKHNQILISSTQRCKTTKSLSRKGTPSQEKSNNTDLDKHSESPIESATKSQTSDSQDLKEITECTTYNSKVTDICNLTEELRKKLPIAAHKEMPVQQNISADLSETPGEVKITSTDFQEDALRLVNDRAEILNLSEQRGNIDDKSQNQKSELYFNKIDYGRKLRNKKMCKNSYRKRSYSSRKNKSRTKRKCKHTSSYMSLTDNQQSNENITEVACHEVSDSKLSAQGENKKERSNKCETVSPQKYNVVYCGDSKTKTTHCNKTCSQEKSDRFPSQSEEISKQERHNDGIYGLSVQCAMNAYERGNTFTCTSPVDSNTSKTHCKPEVPLKELRVHLVRLEIDANVYYLNGGKSINISSIKPSELSLQRHISILNSPKQNALCNLSPSEESNRKQILDVMSCAQKSNVLEKCGATSTKVSHRRHKRIIYKKASKSAKHQDKTLRILASSPVPNSLVSNPPNLNQSCIKPYNNQASKHSSKLISKLIGVGGNSNQNAADVRHKRTSKTAERQEKTLQTLISSPVSNNSTSTSSDLNLSCLKSHKNQIPARSTKFISILTKEDEHSDKSIDVSNREKDKEKSPILNSEKTPNGSVETVKTRGIRGRWRETANYNTTAISRSKIKSSFDNTEKTETSKQYCSKLSKGKVITSNLSVDSANTATNSQNYCDVSHSFNNKMKPSGNYKTASNSMNPNPLNIYPEVNNMLCSKLGEASPDKNVNKNLLKDITGADFKICEQVNNLSNNYKPFTPSDIKSRKLETAKNYGCFRDNIEVNKCNNASSISEINKEIENITSQTICRETFRNSRKLTIENYRKLRQSDLHNCSKLNASNNNMHNMNSVQPCASYFKVKASHSDAPNTMLRHADKKLNMSPRLDSTYMDQKELCINNSISCLNQSTASRNINTETWKHNAANEFCRVPLNFLENLCITNKYGTISFDKKYKKLLSAVFLKEKENKCQQILQSANHCPPEYKQVQNTLKHITTHHNDGEDEQCKIIRKEILKSAYMTPQLAVLTADSPTQSFPLCFEEKHPETETILNTAANIYCSPVSSDLKDSEYAEVATVSHLHGDEHQIRKQQNKSNDAQTNKSLEVENEFDSTATLTRKSVTNEKMDVNNDSIRLNVQHGREGTEVSNRKSVSCSILQQQLNKGKYDTVSRNRSESINCTTRAIPLSSPLRENENNPLDLVVKQTHGKDICRVDAKKFIENKDIGAQSKICTVIYDSRMEAKLSGVQDEPNVLSFHSTWEDRCDKFVTSVGTSMNNSTEYKPRKGLKRKNESAEEKVVEISRQNESSSLEATEQADSLIEKERCTSKKLEPLKEHILWKCVEQDAQEDALYKATETSTLQQSTEINNSSSHSFAERNTQKIFSNTLDVINKGEPACSADKGNYGASNADFGPPSLGDTDFVPDYELSDGNSRSCSEDNSRAVFSQGHLLMFPKDVSNSVTPFETSLGTQLQSEPNISSNGDKNYENRAPKRVCYTSNFIRKDLSNDNVPLKSETKRLVQSKSPYSLGKAIRIDERSKSLESRLNNKPEEKSRISLSYRKTEAMCTKFLAGSALREISHHQGESDKTDLCEQKLATESLSTSSIITKSRLMNRNVSNNNNTENNSEVNPPIDGNEKVDALNLFNCKRNSSDDELREEKTTTAIRNAKKVSANFFTNADSKYLATKSNYNISKRCKKNDWIQGNSLFNLKGKTEASKLLPDLSTRGIGKQLLHAEKTNKRIDEMNAVVHNICNERFASLHRFIKHQRLHCRKRLYMSNYYKGTCAFRDQLNAREAYSFYNKRTRRPLRQCWQVAPESNGRFELKRNAKQSFYRRTGLRNNGNGALSRLSENLQNRKSKRCNTCGTWFTNNFQFFHHFKEGCKSLPVPNPSIFYK